MEFTKPGRCPELAWCSDKHVCDILDFASIQSALGKSQEIAVLHQLDPLKFLILIGANVIQESYKPCGVQGSDAVDPY